MSENETYTIEIFETKDCAWCFNGEMFLYAKNREELENTLDSAYEYYNRQKLPIV